MGFSAVSAWALAAKPRAAGGARTAARVVRRRIGGLLAGGCAGWAQPLLWRGFALGALGLVLGDPLCGAETGRWERPGWVGEGGPSVRRTAGPGDRFCGALQGRG